jgi:hypothetical protein
MKHPSNRDLFAHWNAQRGEGLAPARGDIDPAAIRQALGDTFVLAANPAAGHPFRLAGTRLCALVGRELKNESFLQLWEKSAQVSLRELIAVVLEEKVGVVASVTAAVEADPVLAVNLELLLLPLQHETKSEARVLGGMAPMAAPYWLGVKRVGPLRLGMFRHVGPSVDVTDAPSVVPAPGRIRYGWTVYEGGRSS